MQTSMDNSGLVSVADDLSRNPTPGKSLHREGAAVLVMGLCSRGPYRYAEDNIRNVTVKWISWGYNEEYVDPEVLRQIESGIIREGTEVLFCDWSLITEPQADLIRRGVLDHISYRGGYVAVTIFLGEFVSGVLQLPDRSHFLCRYVDTSSAMVAPVHA